MMMRETLLSRAMTVLALLPAGVLADWDEDFEDYEVGSGMHGQGGWEGWDDNQTYDAYVTDAQSHSPEKSVDICCYSDLVHQFSGYTLGQWTFTAWQYIPSDFDGEQYFILLNTYFVGGQYNWSTQLGFYSIDGEVFSDFEDSRLPLIYDRWVEIRVEIDIDADWQWIYYGGQLLSTKSWTDGVTGGGAHNIAAVDLYAHNQPNSTSVYYDSLSLKFGLCVGDLDGDGDTDHGDLGAFLGAWDSKPGDPNWDRNADIDGDGHVYHPDLGILLADWGCGTGL